MSATRLPAFQFYPADLQKDTGYKRCTKAERGAFLDFLCLVHECPFRGAAYDNGTAMDLDEVASAIGGDKAENKVLLKSILAKGPIKVWSKVHSKVDLNTSRPDLCPEFPDGTFYSRRMVRDEIKRIACSDAGKAGGGNPVLTTFKGTSKGTRKGQPKGKGGSSSSSSSSDPISPPPVDSTRDGDEAGSEEAAQPVGRQADDAPPANGARRTPRLASRTPDPLWDTVCDLFGLKPVTAPEKKRIGSVVRDLKQKEATPEAIRAAYGKAQAKGWEDLSPEGLVTRLDQLTRPTVPAAPSGVYVPRY